MLDKHYYTPWRRDIQDLASHVVQGGDPGMALLSISACRDTVIADAPIRGKNGTIEGTEPFKMLKISPLTVFHSGGIGAAGGFRNYVFDLMAQLICYRARIALYYNEIARPNSIAGSSGYLFGVLDVGQYSGQGRSRRSNEAH